MSVSQNKADAAKPKHTPGPWIVNLDGPFTLGGGTVSVLAINQEGFVEREISTLLMNTDEWPNGEGWLEDAANATLITAAPYLLEALEAHEKLDTLHKKCGRDFWEFLGQWLPEINTHFIHIGDALDAEAKAFHAARRIVREMRVAAIAKAEGNESAQ